MKWIVSLMLIAAVGLCGPAAMAWVDNFESYPWQNWETLPSPWEDVSNMFAQPGWGYPGTTLMIGAGGPTQANVFGHAFRPTGVTVDGSLVGRMYIDPDPVFSWNQAWLGLTTDKTVGGNGEFLGGSSAYFDIVNHGTLGPQLRFWVQSGSDANLLNVAVTSGDWYDVKLDVTGLGMDAYYKLSSAANWTSMGTLQAYAGFVPNYVAMSAHHGADMDDVGYGPDVGTLEGKVSLEDFSGDLSLATLRIEAMQNGAVVKTEEVRVTWMQNPIPYSISPVVVGVYDVRFSAMKWVQHVEHNVSIISDLTTTLDASLSNGDANGDGAVTSADVNALLSDLDKKGD